MKSESVCVSDSHGGHCFQREKGGELTVVGTAAAGQENRAAATVPRNRK